MDRYHRQSLLAHIGADGQAQLSRARVLLVGCGALGSVIADQLARAGVGHLRIVDRDIVELTNLQRQVLFDETDVHDGTPKAVAAAARLARVNSEITLEPIVTDVHAGNIEELAGLTGELPRVDLLLDGTDSVETRYLLNDVSVKHGVPWVYGACVGTVGRMMAVLPGETACLRCIFPTPPGPGELPTCDTAGVFSPVSATVASLQTAAALKLLSGNRKAVGQELMVLDLWENRLRSIPTHDARRDDCLACGQRILEFLDHRGGSSSTSLCGRNAIQVRPAGRVQLNLAELALKLASVGTVEQTPHLIRCHINSSGDLKLTIFPDGRLLVHGTSDPHRARSLYSRYIGG